MLKKKKLSCPKLFSLLCAVIRLSGCSSSCFYLMSFFFLLFFYFFFFFKEVVLSSVSYLTGASIIAPHKKTTYVRNRFLTLFILDLRVSS